MTAPRSLERLDNLSTAARNDFSARRCNDVERAYEAQIGRHEKKYNGDSDRTADRRRRRFYYLKRCPQKRQFFAPLRMVRRNKRRDARNLAIPTALADLAALADLMNTCLQAMQRCVAAAGLDQRVMGAVFNQTAAIERDNAIRRAHG